MRLPIIIKAEKIMAQRIPRMVGLKSTRRNSNKILRIEYSIKYKRKMKPVGSFSFFLKTSQCNIIKSMKIIRFPRLSYIKVGWKYSKN